MVGFTESLDLLTGSCNTSTRWYPLQLTGRQVSQAMPTLKRGSSAPIHSTGHSVGCLETASCHHTSRPSTNATSARLAASAWSYTSTVLMLCPCASTFLMAESTMPCHSHKTMPHHPCSALAHHPVHGRHAHLISQVPSSESSASLKHVEKLSGLLRSTLRLMGLAPRLTAEAVSTTEGLESRMRPARESAEKPAKTTECTAPILAHANCTEHTLWSACDHMTYVLSKFECLPSTEAATVDISCIAPPGRTQDGQ